AERSQLYCPGGNPGSASPAERNGRHVVVQSETSWLQWLAIRVTVMFRAKILCSRAAHPLAGSDTNTVNCRASYWVATLGIAQPAPAPEALSPARAGEAVSGARTRGRAARTSGTLRTGEPPRTAGRSWGDRPDHPSNGPDPGSGRGFRRECRDFSPRRCGITSCGRWGGSHRGATPSSPTSAIRRFERAGRVRPSAHRRQPRTGSAQMCSCRIAVVLRTQVGGRRSACRLRAAYGPHRRASVRSWGSPGAQDDVVDVVGGGGGARGPRALLVDLDGPAR